MKKHSIVNKKNMCIYLALLLSILSVASVDVYAKQKVMSIKLNKKSRTIYVGEKAKIKAEIRNKTKDAKIVWKSSNEKIASVTAKGVVTGKKAGKVRIKAQIKGKKITAICVVTVKKKSVSKPTTSPDVTPTKKPEEPEASPEITPTGKPEASPEITPTRKPEEPEASPDVTPTEKPEEPEASPDVTPTGKPEEPEANPEITPTGKPEEPQTSPEVSPAPEESPSPKPATPVVAVKLAQDASETVYLLDRDYEGTVHIGFAGKEFTVSGKVRDALSILQTTYTTKTNHDGTVMVSRAYPEECWTLTDLETGSSYSMWIESRSSFDPAYENCGAIHFLGDVTSIIGVW